MCFLRCVEKGQFGYCWSGVRVFERLGGGTASVASRSSTSAVGKLVMLSLLMLMSDMKLAHF